MKYVLPSYVCQQDITPGKLPFTCTVHIGGKQYTGAAARLKKAAEINAARVALFAIESNTEAGSNDSSSQYTVIPCKKRPAMDSPQDRSPKPKKARKSGRKVQVESGVPVVCKDLLGGQDIKAKEDSGELTEEESNVVRLRDASNLSPDGKLDMSWRETPTLRIVSEFQIKDLLALAAEIQKLCGGEAVV